MLKIIFSYIADTAIFILYAGLTCFLIRVLVGVYKDLRDRHF